MKKFLLIVAVLPTLFLLDFLPPRKNCIHSLFLIGTRIRISKADINDGFHMDLPLAPDKHVIPCFWNSPAGMYALLWYAAHLVYKGLYVYTVKVEGLSGEVNDIITYLILKCNDNTSIASSEVLTHRKGMQATDSFLLKDRGVNVIKRKTKLKITLQQVLYSIDGNYPFSITTK